MTKQELKEAVARRERWNECIRTKTTVDTAESKREQMARVVRARRDYAYFVEYYFPHWCTDKTGALIQSAPFHIHAAKYILENSNTRAVFQWARGHAKSTHMGTFIPMWLMAQKKKKSA
jgi:hypothetical protein